MILFPFSNVGVVKSCKIITVIKSLGNKLTGLSFHCLLLTLLLCSLLFSSDSMAR